MMKRRTLLLLSCLVLYSCGSSTDEGSTADASDPADTVQTQEVVPATCTADTDCAGVAKDPCQEASCDTASGLCVVAPVEGCYPCDGDTDCAAVKPQLCAQAACDPCAISVCGDGICELGTAEDGAACDDGDLCTEGDTCQAGACTAGAPVVCEALDQCHDVGTCDGATGLCSNPALDDGTTCDDGNLCTQADACQAGVCTGSDPVVCEAPDQCHDPGTCDGATGLCSAPAKDDGASCEDGSLCTEGDTCQAGVCTAGAALTCEALDQCHDAGTCDEATGLCTHPAKDDGTACDDGNGCTQTDSCQAGVCTGADPLVCVAVDDCHDAGTCDPADGVCSSPVKDDDTACDDGNPCTQNDTCHAGVCTSADPVVCVAIDECHDVGVCDPSDGICSAPVKADGEGCDDGDLCTTGDTCQTGVCTAGMAVVCDAPGQCLEAGVCQPTTGLCTYEAAADATACDDGDLCTADDVCQAGVCAGALMDCSDGNPCTVDACTAGACVTTEIVGCVPELVCDDLLDDNGNGWVDCDDLHCTDDPACAGRPTGDLCVDPFLVNDGAPVDASLVGQTLTYPGDLASDFHLDYWPSGVPEDDTLVRDAVYRLTLAEPLVVTVTLDFDGDDPTTLPWAYLYVYTDFCRWESLIDEASGEDDAEDSAEIVRTFPAGTYYVMAQGARDPALEWQTYQISFAFGALPTTETVCDDTLDEDDDGATDCADPDCGGDPLCPDCPVAATITCGETVTGVLGGHDVDGYYLYYAFTVDETTNVMVTKVMAADYTDQVQINYGDDWFEPFAGGCYGDQPSGLWHGGNNDYFTAQPGATYGFKVFITDSTYDDGDYSFTVYCNDGGPEDVCDDGTDGDADGFIDCEDPDCFDDTSCSGGDLGDTCGDARLVNGGTAISLADVGTEGLELTYWSTTTGRSNDLSADCLPASAQGPDVVYRFELADTLAIGVNVDSGFFDPPFGAPGLYLYSGQCVDQTMLGCGDTYSFGGVGFGFAVLYDVLPPGLYYLVVDSGATGTDGIPDSGAFELTMDFDVPPVPESCLNGVDDDADGDTDCLDSECFADAYCTGGLSGESCDEPYLVKGGQPLGVGEEILLANTTVGRDNDLSGSCSYYSWYGPDVVYTFWLDATTVVTATVSFDNALPPSAYLLDATCDQAASLACATGEDTTDQSATVTATLEPGQYHLVIDAGANVMGYNASSFDLTITTAAP